MRIVPLVRDGHVLVSCELADGYTDDVRDFIQSGLQTTFSYTVELRMRVPAWVDKTLASAVVSTSVEYDNLTRRHTVSRLLDGRVQESQVIEDEAQVRKLLTTFDRLPLFRTAKLEPNREYYVLVGRVLGLATGPSSGRGTRRLPGRRSSPSFRSDVLASSRPRQERAGARRLVRCVRRPARPMPLWGPERVAQTRTGIALAFPGQAPTDRVVNRRGTRMAKVVGGSKRTQRAASRGDAHEVARPSLWRKSNSRPRATTGRAGRKPGATAPMPWGGPQGRAEDGAEARRGTRGREACGGRRMLPSPGQRGRPPSTKAAPPSAEGPAQGQAALRPPAPGSLLAPHGVQPIHPIPLRRSVRVPQANNPSSAVRGRGTRGPRPFEEVGGAAGRHLAHAVRRHDGVGRARVAGDRESFDVLVVSLDMSSADPSVFLRMVRDRYPPRGAHRALRKHGPGRRAPQPGHGPSPPRQAL